MKISALESWESTPDQKNFYIADNVLIGREDPTRLLGWFGSSWENFKDYPQNIESFYGIGVLGQGHVVCYNYIANFHDGIVVDVGDNVPSEKRDQQPMAIDIYNNDISNISDNAIETDPVVHNIRVLRNRCINNGTRPLSAQNIFGGPAYFIRNIVYHSPEGGSIKFYRSSTGLIVYNNTLCAGAKIRWSSRPSPDSNMNFRNNLILDGESSEGEFDHGVFFMGTYTSYTSCDYNGYRPNEGVEHNYTWISPPENVLIDYGPREKQEFKTLKEFSDATGQEQHGIELDYDIFQA